MWIKYIVITCTCLFSFVFISTLIPKCDYVWMILSDFLRFICCCCKKKKKKDVLSSLENNKLEEYVKNIEIEKCPPGCPCAFWPTPYEACGVEFAASANFVMNVIYV